MSDQLLAFSVFAAAVVLLSIFMWPSSRRLDGRQRYRRGRKPGRDLDPNGNARSSVTPLAAFFGILFGGSSASDADNFSDSDSTEDIGDAGGDAGGGE